MSLLDFCDSAMEQLAPLKGTHKITAFALLRYHELGLEFPHRVFSTEEASLDFFEKTAAYLKDPATIPEKAPDGTPFLEYKKNYFDWLKDNLSGTKTTTK